MASKAQREGTLNRFGKLDTPEATAGVGLHKTALRAEAVEVNGAEFATIDCDGRKSLKIRYLRQSALAVLTMKLIFGAEVVWFPQPNY